MVQFDQVEAMEAAASSLFIPLRITAPRSQPFRAEVTDASIGSASIAKMAYTPGLVRRMPRVMSSADRDLLLVTLQRTGTSVVTQDGRRCEGGPGTLIAYDTRKPYDLACPNPSDVVAIAIPAQILGPNIDLIRDRTAVAVGSDRGIQSVVAAFFTGLADTVFADGGQAPGGLNGARLVDAAASLLVTAFTGTPCERVDLPTSLGERILSYAAANLDDPGLSTASVARQFGISQRYLHALMHAQDVRFSSWVRWQRLRRIRQDLLDPRLANWTVAAIAARWGIYDAVHISRALRAEFGCSAAELRASAADH